MSRTERCRCRGILLTVALLATQPILADQPKEAPPTAATMLLLPVRVVPGGESRHDDMLLREISRQALLIAARDELHLATRDEALREAFPAGTKRDELPITLTSIIPGGADPTSDFTKAKILIYRGDAEEPAWEKVFDFGAARFMEKLIEKCGELSRTEFVALLAPGEPSQAKWSEDDPPVPDDVETQLAEMDLIGQFAAVRRLHRLMREEGESPRRLGALVRGYANLGLLTGCFVAPAHKVFLARSLLYADRLCWRDRNSSWALWHRGYARALTGVHATAIEDLEAADKLAADRKRPRPDWVDLIDAFCRFDEARLSAAAEHGQLAAVLRLRSLAFANRYSVVTEVAQRLLQDCPDCYFAIDAIYELRSLGTGRMASELGPRAAGEWLNKRLTAMGGAVADAVQPADDSEAKRNDKERAGEGRMQLIRRLREAGTVDRDQQEPSLSALAALVEDLTFLHVMIRIEFYSDMLSVPVDDMIAEARPLIADHPLRAFIEAQSGNFERRRQAAKEIRENDAIPSMVENSLQPLAIALHKVDAELFRHLADLAFLHNDRIYYDLLTMNARYGASANLKTYFATTLAAISPHAPTTVALQIAYDWPAAEKHAAEWEKRYSTSPEVLAAMGTRYQQLKRYDDAERCWREKVEAAPDFAGYRALSNLYWAKGDVEAWIAACEQALEQPSFGLEHARLQTTIANYFVGRKEYDAALPYASAAAQTGAAWAMLCEASVWEGKQDWERAEQLVRYTVERYADIPLAWICFCRRTGKGDLVRATRLAEQYIEHAEAKQVQRENFALAGAYIMTEQVAKALTPLRDEFMATKNPSAGMLAALIADQVHDDAARDQLLSDVVAYGPRFKMPNGEPRKELLRLAQWLVDDLKKGGQADLNLTAFDALFTITDDNERLIANHILGRYLLLHGKRETAIRYWKRAMGSTDLMGLHRSLSGYYLNELGVGPEDYQQELSAKPPGIKEAGK